MTEQEKTAAVQSVVEASIRGEQPLSVGWLVKENADLRRELKASVVQINLRIKEIADISDKLQELETRLDKASKAFAELKREVAAGSGAGE